jgi:hypothetical protein
VGAVALNITIGVLGEVLEELGAALEVLVLHVDAGVDDVGAGALAGSVVVGVSGAAGLLGGDAGQAPGGVLLSGRDGDDGILLDVVNLFLLLASDQCSSGCSA